MANLKDLSRAELWALLPKPVRSSLGNASGGAPETAVLAFMFDSEGDARTCLERLGVAAPVPERCVQALRLLQHQAGEQAARIRKRKNLIFPEEFALAAKQLRLAPVAATEPAHTWLLQRSGTFRLPVPKAQKRSRLFLSRAAQEQAELVKWRSATGALLRELGLPITSQTALADDPEVALTAALGATRASSLRKHVREFNKLMTYCKASTDSAWPKHVGVVLNYLHERHCEPCNPSVPQAILRS